MTLHVLPNLEQRSPEWYDQRRGIVTASAVSSLITYGPPAAQSVACPTCNARPTQPCVSIRKGKPASTLPPTPIKSLHEARTTHAATRPPVHEVADNDTARNLTSVLVAERVSGWTEDIAITSDMWRGIEHEPYARDVYAENYGDVETVGFMLREEDGWQLGYSPDGLVGDDGLIEIKCPRAKTHVKTILADEVPAQYMAQCQAGLLVSGRKWIDFVSFVAGMPLYRKRVEPDLAWFDAIAAACIAFEGNAAEIVADYRSKTNNLPTTVRLDFEIKVA